MLTTIKPQEYDLCIAIDTSKKSYSVTSMNHKRSYQNFKMPADPQNLIHYTQKRFSTKRSLFVYEAGPGGYSLHDELTKNGFSCMIVHPASVAKAPNDRVKTNRLDSKKLAEQSLSNPTQIPCLSARFLPGYSRKRLLDTHFYLNLLSFLSIP